MLHSTKNTHAVATRLREELEAENGGIDIPAEIRWLGGAKVLARYQEIQGGTSSVVAAVLGEETFSWPRI